MEYIVVPGKVYAVTAQEDCVLTAENGWELELTAGKQEHFTAQFEAFTGPEGLALTATFKQAPAKLKALGILGGGVDTLPSGYLAAEFCENSELGRIDTGFKAYGDTAVECEFVPTIYNWVNFYYASGNQNSNPVMFGSYDYNGAYGRRYTYGYGNNNQVRLDGRDGRPSYSSTLGKKYKTKQIGGAFYINGELVYEVPYEEYESKSNLHFFGNSVNNTAGVKNLRMYRAKVSRAGVKLRDFVPAIDTLGVPCFYDKVEKKPFYFKAYTTGAVLIVGMTCRQALQLAKLPAGGGALTVSLPSNWQDDEGVVNALATAEAKGWVFTYQTYEATEGAASTLALRRILVRKTQSEHGGYVAADGSRWLVEWCAGMIGADPQEHGYEPYRSVDAAVAYWELEPYVYPEEEELLTEQ